MLPVERRLLWSLGGTRHFCLCLCYSVQEMGKNTPKELGTRFPAYGPERASPSGEQAAKRGVPRFAKADCAPFLPQAAFMERITSRSEYFGGQPPQSGGS